MNICIIAVATLSVMATVITSSAATSETVKVWNFDAELPGRLPADFSIGSLFDGRPAGDWKVLQRTDAPSPPHVLGQVQGKGAEHAYKVVLVDGSRSSDLEVEVSLLAVDGKADMGGGLIWRAADDRNYYLTRANPLEQNIRIYKVINGVRHMLNNFDYIIDVRQWHHLRVTMAGCNVRVFFDKKEVFDFCDETLKSGRIGLWTKSDATTYFDNLILKIRP